MMKYPSDVTETQFELVSKYIPHVKSKRPRKYRRIDIFNAILYRVKTGCMWRYLPKEYPKWQLVYYYFCKWKKYIFRYINHKLNQLSYPSPSILILDSQSVDSSEELSLGDKGYDGHKKKHGIKRFILTDIMGSIWFTLLTTANTSEHIGAKELLRFVCNSQAYPNTATTILADKGYESKHLIAQCKKYGVIFKPMKSDKRIKLAKTEIGKKINKDQITIHQYLNKQISQTRWVVERSFSWLNKHRILVKDYERTYSSHEANIYLAMIGIKLRRGFN
jgi:putative transposase